jgi:putative aminopeptidase FrvX
MRQPRTQFDLYLILLRALVRAPAVVGYEEPFFTLLQRELELHGARVDRFQGVLAASGSDPDSLIVSIHADRHGIVCTGPDEFQYAALVAKSQGDLDGNSISEQTIDRISNRFSGERVEAYDPWHGGYLGQGEVKSAYHCERRQNIVFEIDGLPPLRPGTPVAYLQHLEHDGDQVAAQLDNVLSVAIGVDLFRRGFQGTVLFTAEEEAGRSWRYLMSWFRRRQLETARLLVLDTSPYPDRQAAGAQQVVLRNRDANGIFARGLIEELVEVAERRGIAYSFKDVQIEESNRQRLAEGRKPASFGRTELGRVVQASNGEINGATLQIPTTGYHTPRETASLDAIEAAVTLAAALW